MRRVHASDTKRYTSQDGRRVDSGGNAGSALLESEELVEVRAGGDNDFNYDFHTLLIQTFARGW